MRRLGGIQQNAAVRVQDQRRSFGIDENGRRDGLQRKPDGECPAAASSDSKTVLPLASNGTWICEDVSVASRTGTAVSALLAD